MSKSATGLRIVLVSVIVLLALTARAAAPDRPRSDVLVEAAWARPKGELARDFNESSLGIGANDGLELGFRWRYYFSDAVSLSPAFHFLDYRDFESTDDLVGDYRIAASSLRYTLELMYRRGDESSPLRPFLAISGGLYRNRVAGFNKGVTEPFDESVNTVGYGIRGGLGWGPFEISAVYHLNRFASWRYFQTGSEENYNWDSFSVRAGWIIPVNTSD